MSTLSSANVTDVNLVLKERTHMRLCLNMLIFTHNLGNWLMAKSVCLSVSPSVCLPGTLVTRAHSVQDIAPHDRGMLLVSCDQISQS